jgi:hypothetical protein
MITDMHRLERAARLSMGDFDAVQPTAPPLRQPFFPSKLTAALAALVVLAAAVLLLG